jgi:hypothetical protein
MMDIKFIVRLCNLHVLCLRYSLNKAVSNDIVLNLKAEVGHVEIEYFWFISSAVAVIAPFSAVTSVILISMTFIAVEVSRIVTISAMGSLSFVVDFLVLSHFLRTVSHWSKDFRTTQEIVAALVYILKPSYPANNA